MNERMSVHAGKFLKFFVAILLIFASLITITACNNKTEPLNFVVTFNYEGIENITVKEGKKVTLPSNPTNYGYIFTGWYKDENLQEEWIFESDVVTKDISLYAGWEVDSELLNEKKTEKINAFNEILLQLGSENYSPENWQLLKNIVTLAITTVNNTSAVEQLQEINIECVNAECSTIETKAQTLEKAKQAKIIALDNLLKTYNESDYSTYNWTALNSIINSAIDTVNSATDILVVQQINISTVTGECNSIATLVQELESAKLDKTNEINALIAGDSPQYESVNYSTDNWLEITTIINGAIQSTQSAETFEMLALININDIVNECDNIQTIQQELEQLQDAKLDLTSEINALIAGDIPQYESVNYSTDNWQEIILIIENAIDEINAYTNILEVNNFCICVVISECNALKTLAQELEIEKQLKLTALSDLLHTYNESDYSTDNWTALNGIINSAIDTVNTATDILVVQQINISTLTSECNTIATLTQEFENAKLDLINKINALIYGDNPQFKSADYSSDNWNDIITIINSAIQSIENAESMQELSLILITDIIQHCNVVQTEAFLTNKSLLINQLNNLIDNSNKNYYTPYHWAQLNTAITDACLQIEEITTVAELAEFDLASILQQCENNKLANLLLSINDYMTTEVYNCDDDFELDNERAYILLTDELIEPDEYFEITVNGVYFYFLNDTFVLNLCNNKVIDIPIFIYEDNKLYIAGAFINLNIINEEGNNLITLKLGWEEELQLLGWEEELQLICTNQPAAQLQCDISADTEDVEITEEDGTIKIITPNTNQKINFDILNDEGESILNEQSIIYISKVQDEDFQNPTFALVKGGVIDIDAICNLELVYSYPEPKIAHFHFSFYIVGVGVVSLEIEASIIYFK